MAEIIRAEHAGFCFGVKQAIDMTDNQIEKRSEGRIYTCGPLIHNRFVTDDLERRGVSIIDSIEEAEAGDMVIVRLTARRGTFFQRAEEKGIHIVDATCPFVDRIHKLAEEASDRENGGYRRKRRSSGSHRYKRLVQRKTIVVGSREEAEKVEESSVFLVPDDY